MEVIDSPVEPTVEGYPNIRICNLFLSLDSDSALKEREKLIFDRRGLTTLRFDLIKFGAKAWERLRQFYSGVEWQVARPYGQEFILTNQDWTLMHAEVVERYKARITELDREAAALRVIQHAESVERKRVRQLEEETIKEAQWWADMNAGKIMYGPVDWEPYQDGGHGLLIRLRGGQRMTEIRPGDWVQISGCSRWGKVLSVYPGTPDTEGRLDPYGASFTYERDCSLGWDTQRVRNLMHGFPYFQVLAVSRQKPIHADYY